MNPRLRQNWRRKSLDTQAGVYKRQMWVTLRVMCQMSMKLPAMFDQNLPHTFDKIVKKLITIKNALKA